MQRHPRTLAEPGALGVAAIEIRPEFIRLPRAGEACPHTGLSRTALNALILPTAANGFRPAVKSMVLRQRGNQRGIRLISFDSLIAHLNALAARDEAATQKVS